MMRSKIRAGSAAIFLAAAASQMQAANVVQSWGSAVNGTWTDTTKWSGGVVPNNVPDTHTVTIGVTGAAYTVTLAAPATINDFTLSSANATLAISGATFSVVNSAINLNAGTMLIST